MSEHLQPLLTATTNANVQRDTTEPHRAIFWSYDGGNYLRIASKSRAPITVDGELCWTEATVQTATAVQRTLLQRWAKTEIPGALLTPDGKEVQLQKDARQIFLLWMKAAGVQIDAEIAERFRDNQDIKKIGPSIAYMDSVPLRKTESAEAYHPDYVLVEKEKAEHTFQQGLNYIFGQVSHIPQTDETPSIQYLRQLREFHRNETAWGFMENGDGNTIYGNQSKNLLFVVPPDHPSVQKNSIAGVNAGPAKPYLAFHPHDITVPWAGILGAHEFMHLQDAATGVIPKHEATRAEVVFAEERAFRVTVAAADIASGGKIGRGIEAAQTQFNIHTIEEALNIDDRTLIQIARSLDVYITPDPPQSYVEAEMRLDSYRFMLAFKIIDKKYPEESRRSEQYRKAVEYVYDQRGALPPK